MSTCIKDRIQNMNPVIGCTVGCQYCYARNNVKRWHMIKDLEPIIGDENMIQELPKSFNKVLEAQRAWHR